MSSYINQIDAAIAAVQPIAGQNLTVTPSPTGGLVLALTSSIAVNNVAANGTVTAVGGVLLTNPVPASSSANQSSSILSLTGSYWTGSASAADTWTLQSGFGGGANPGGGLTLSHTGDNNADNFTILAEVIVGGSIVAAGGISLGGSASLGGNTPATALQNYTFGSVDFVGSYWTGSAPAPDTWAITPALGTGANPTTSLVVTHVGTPQVGSFTLANPTPATSIATSQNPAKLVFSGAYWNGSTSIPESWTTTTTFNAPPSTSLYTIQQPGSGGSIVFNADNIQANGNLMALDLQVAFNTGSAGTIYPATSVGNSVGNFATYQVTMAPGGQPRPGQYVNATGFTNLSNNGRFIVFSATGTTAITVYNPAAVAETHAATVTVDGSYYDQAGYDVYGPTPINFPISGTNFQSALGLENVPGSPNLIFNLKGNATDAAYFRNVTDGPTGNHWFEWGVFTNGIVSPPILLQLGQFGGQASAGLNVPLTFHGSSSGSASLGVAAVAGTPNQLLLPTTTGTIGQVLTTNGGNPQQLSWTSGGGPQTETVRVSYASNPLTAGSLSSSIPVTFSTPFVDGNYTVSLSVETAAAMQSATVVATFQKQGGTPQNGVNVQVLNNDSLSHTVTVHVTARHD